MVTDRPGRHPLTITVSCVLLALACLLLAWWQWGRVNRPVDGYTGEPMAVPLRSLVPAGAPVPLTALARQVTVTGTFVASGQQLVPGHQLGGATVSWVVTPLLAADGSRVLIVRGWSDGSSRGLLAPPTGIVTVTGRVELGSPVPSGSTSQPDQPGYLVRTAQTPPDPLSLQPVPEAAPRSAAPAQFHLQNAIYVSQWALLGVIVLISGWRLRRAGREFAPRSGPASAEPPATTVRN